MPMKHFLYLILVSAVCSSAATIRQENDDSQTSRSVVWTICEFVETPFEKIIFSGHPVLVSSPYGQAVLFNGNNDAIFLDTAPILGLTSFTIEAIIRPDAGGLSEQRFLHLGEVNGDRALLETRVNDQGWYLDAHIRSGNERLTLIDSTLLHPLNQWYHVAAVFENETLATYVNGKKELEGKIGSFKPVESGKTSIGVRQDRRDWYKGAIYKIRVSPVALSENEFLPH